MRRGLRRRALLGAAALAALVGLVLALTDPLRVLELDTVDTRFTVRGADETPRDVAVVAMDDETFREHQEFPLRRSLHAKVIDELLASGATAIAYDVQFTEETEPEEDNALIEAVGRARGKVVLAATSVNERGETEVFGGEENVRALGARTGHGTLVPDEDGVSRRMPFSVDRLESLPVVTVHAATGRRVGRGEFDGDGTAWIDYAGPPGTIPTYSFADVAAGRVDRARFRERIVVVGASSPSLQDLHPTSYSTSEFMSGPEIHANAISTLRRDLPLREAPGAVEALVTLAVSVVPPLAVLALGLLGGLLASVGFAAAYAVVAQLAFGGGQILPVVAPAVGFALGVLCVITFGWMLEALERERVRDVFARFVPAGVVDEVLARTDGDLRLGGKRLQATVVFCDVRGFTGFAERLPAEQVIEILNRFLDEMSQAIQEQEGTLVAYQGDGILAAFGAPIEQIDHADRALAAVREMAGPRLKRFNAWLAEQGIDEPFRIGVGVNSGMIMSGNVGSAWRVEYTAVGDTVNTASRLEAMTKGTPHAVLISDTTRAMLRREADDLVYVDAMTVRGKNVKANLWSLMPPAPAR